MQISMKIITLADTMAKFSQLRKQAVVQLKDEMAASIHQSGMPYANAA